MLELQHSLKEKIIFAKERCLLSRNCKISCGLCTKICPAKAIELKEGGICFNELDCENCGACRAVCPSEAFTVKDLTFLKDFCSCENKELSIGCTLNDKNRQDFNVNCYAFLTEGELFYLLSKQDNITFQAAYCKACRYKLGYLGFARSVNVIQKLLMGKSKIFLSNTNHQDQGVSRRHFFQWFKQKTLTIIAEALPFEDREPSSPVPFRRQTLLVGLKNYSGDLSRTTFIRHIQALSSCTGCGGCVSICPSNAYQLEDNKLFWKAKNCLNCDLCLKSCPEKALDYGDFVSQEEFWAVKTLKEYVGKRCSTCGTFYSGNMEYCEFCLDKNKTLEKSFDICLNH